MSNDWQSDSVVEEIEPAIAGELDRQIERLSNLKNKVSDITREAKEAVEREWERRLEIVPGDELLDKLCARFGVRFRKETDSTRLAAEMVESEIDGEIADVIRSMGR